MYKRHNAFTLIELLAVIIILAIVALIATPIILDVVEDASISAGRSEANMIYNGINNYCETMELKKEIGTLENNDIDYSKKTTFTNEEITRIVNLGNAVIEKVKYDGKKIIDLVIQSNNHIFKLCLNENFVMDNEKCPLLPGKLIDVLIQQYNLYI